MADLISRKSSDPELDIERLRAVLDTINYELTIPFIERRARSKSHKKNPIEELSIVIQEVTAKERELQAAIGIAKMLLERNDELSKRSQKLRTKKHFYRENLRELRAENKSLKENFLFSEDKFKQVSAALITAEENQVILVAENKRLNKDIMELHEASSPTLQENNEITELIEKHKQEYDYMMSK